jgi:glycosyltransferase involved in cell wall biosynthesis
MKKTVSVIIPALNEERTIFSTVSECLKAKNILEVIVVDDNSADRTVQLSKKAGARVISSKVRGKGTSMQDGLGAAKGEFVVYVDADIKNFSSRIIDAITQPLLEGAAISSRLAMGGKAEGSPSSWRSPFFRNFSLLWSASGSLSAA